MLKKAKTNEVLPIEKRKIKGHIKHVVLELPGLNEQWVTPRKFIHYVFPPSKSPIGDRLPGAKQKWLESMSHLLDDIWWLCELEYHRFWSQVLFDTNSMNGVNSFLHLAPLQQLYFKIDDQPMLLLYKKIKKAVFQFMKRLLRVKESDLNFMSPEKYSEIMKKYNLVPASLLFCLCTLYAKKESETVREMIVHVVQHNGNLKLDSCVVRSIQLFSRMKTKLRNNYRDLKKNLRHSKKSDYIREAMNAYRQNLSSSVQFLANAAVNISSFLHVYAEGCEIFLAHDFDFHIIRVYKKLIIPTYFEISVLFGDDVHIQSYSRLISMLELTRVEFVKSFHVCLQALIDKLGTRLLAYETLQRIVQLLKMALKLENFLIDSNSVKCFNEFHELVKKKCLSDIDLTVINNVFESIKEEMNTTKPEPDPEKNCIEDNHIYNYICDNYDLGSDDSESENDEEEEIEGLSSGDNSSEYSDWSKNENSDAEYECYLEEEDSSAKKLSQLSLEPVPATSSAMPISELDLQSAISQVKDLLPHLGDGFIAMCLKAYNMDVATVINVILENSLLPSLNEVDFSLSKIPSDILEEIQPEYENIPSTSTAENSGLVELKRVEYTSYKEMFNDKEAVNQAKNIYEKYRNTEEDELYNDDVDEDYEEQLFAPPVEVDPEGFYTEYATIPTHNPNHVHEEEVEENCDLDRAKNHQPSENTQPKNARNSPPNRSFRNHKSSNSRGKFKESNNRDEHRNRKQESNHNEKVSNSWRNSGPSREKQNNEKLPNTSQNRDRKRVNSWRNSELPSSHEYRETQDHDRKPLNSWRNSERNNREEQIRDQKPPNSYERETQYRDRENEERDTDRYDHNQKPLDFCENPEVIRARAAHHYHLKQEKRRGFKQNANSNFSKSTSSTQEGGDDQEQRDRHHKNVHKWSNANHSRKYHSDRKRRQF